MSEDDSRQLIRNELKESNIQLAEADVEKIIKRTGGIPIALIWTVGLLKTGYQPDHIIMKLGNATNDVAKFIFDISINEIKSKDAYKLLLAIAMTESEMSRDMIGQLTNVSIQDRDDGLIALEHRSLVYKKDDKFSIHRLTAFYCQHALLENSEIIDQFANIFYRNILAKQIRFVDTDSVLFGYKFMEGNVKYIPPKLTTAKFHNTSLSPSPPNGDYSIVEAEKLLIDNNRIIISGNPGEGKTALLRFMATVLAKNNCIPLFIPLRAYNSQDSFKDELDIFFFDFDLFQRQLLYKFINLNKVVLLLDGLDEVGVTDVENVVQAINEITKKFPQLKIIISTRPTITVIGLKGFLSTAIVPLDPMEIREMINTPFSNDSEYFESFLKALETNRTIQLLARNRLYLNLILQVYISGGEIPKSRYQIIDYVIYYLALKREHSKGMSFDFPERRLIEIFSKIAYYLRIQNKIYFQLAELRNLFSDLDKEDRGWSIERLFTRTGLIAEQGNGVYSFINTLFIDFFCSRYLSNTGSDIRFEDIRHKHEWLDVLYFYICQRPDQDYFLKCYIDDIILSLKQFPELRPIDIPRENFIEEYFIRIQQIRFARPAHLDESEVDKLYISVKMLLDLEIDYHGLERKDYYTLFNNL
jgi:hypothetical protein